MNELDREVVREKGGDPRSPYRRIPLDEAFAVAGWTAAAISSITAAPPAEETTRSPPPAAAMETFPATAIALRAPAASRAGRQQSVAFS
jgi:siroheme synthase